MRENTKLRHEMEEKEEEAAAPTSPKQKMQASRGVVDGFWAPFLFKATCFSSVNTFQGHAFPVLWSLSGFDLVTW